MIFFDLDDTLLDDRTAMREGFVSLAAFRPEVASSGDALFTRWWNLAEVMWKRYQDGVTGYERPLFRRRMVVQALWADVSDGVADEMAAAYTRAYTRNWGRAFADVVPCLDALASQGFGIITNGAAEAQLDKLDRMGIRHRFTVIMTSVEFGKAKPDPAIFLEACRRAGEEPTVCWHIGDRLDKDALPAVAAGLHGIWLNRDPGLPADPRVPTIRSLAELPELVAAQ